MMSRGLVVLLCVALSLWTVLSVSAMHEDEQGKIDWYVQGVGRAFRAYMPSKGKHSVNKLVFVVSATGTVAAISTVPKEGTIRWRRVLSASDPLVCITGSDAWVAVVSRDGLVSVFDAATGNPQTTLALAVSSPVVDCSVAANSKLAIVVFSASEGAATVEGAGDATATPPVNTSHSTVFYVDTQEGTVVSKSASLVFPVAAPLADAAANNVAIRLTPSALWVSVANSGQSYVALLGSSVSESQAVSIEAVDGELVDVLQSSALLRTATNGAVQYFLRVVDGKTLGLAGDAFSWGSRAPGSGLTVALVEAPATATGVSAIVVGRNEHEKVISTTLGSAAATAAVPTELSERAGQQPAVLAGRVLATSGKTQLLLRTSNGHLSLLRDAEVTWTRPEGLSEVVDTRFVSIPRGRPMHDRFGFAQRIVLLSAGGMIYSVLTTNKGSVEWMADAAGDAADQLGLKACDLKALTISARTSHIVSATFALVDGATGATTGHVVSWTYNAETGEPVQKTATKDAAAATVRSVVGELVVMVDTVAHVASGPAAEAIHYHIVDTAAGVIRGFMVPSGATKGVATWLVNLGSAIVASASGDAEWMPSVENIRIFPNASAKGHEVRQKYPTANVLCTAHYRASEDDAPVLVVTAIDTITGTVLGSVRHPDADGPVRLLMAEHMVIYHFFNAKGVRYLVGAWEMFESQEGLPVLESTIVNPAAVVGSLFTKRKTFSSFNTRLPTIATHLLAFPIDITAMGVTRSVDGIARKMVIFASVTGALYSVDLRALSLGILGDGIPFPAPGNPPDRVVVPSTQIISYIYSVQSVRRVVSVPTALESTSHVLAVGLDLFYIRSSSGKPFDVLNHDFNYELLMLFTGGVAVATLAVRYFANKAQLSAAWA